MVDDVPEFIAGARAVAAGRVPPPIVMAWLDCVTAGH